MKVCQRNQDTAQHLFTSEDDDGKRFKPHILHMEAVVVMETGGCRTSTTWHKFCVERR